jgi:hypothetical protein
MPHSGINLYKENYATCVFGGFNNYVEPME